MASPPEILLDRVQMSARGRRHEHIIRAGNSQGWSTVPEIIQWIERQQYAFYTLVGGRKAYVGVRRDVGKAPYIRTYADGVWNDNLLALQRAA
jgi:Protein of unknown function (DUF3892)